MNFATHAENANCTIPSVVKNEEVQRLMDMQLHPLLVLSHAGKSKQKCSMQLMSPDGIVLMASEWLKIFREILLVIWKASCRANCWH